MGAGKLEAGGGVIEFCALPLGRSMAQGAVLGKSGGGMFRILRVCIVRRMAGPAGGGSTVISPSGMARQTRGRRVATGKRETARRMIKLPAFPARGLVTIRAILGETARHMIGILDVAVVRLVAAKAVLRQSAEVSSRMAGNALDSRMAPRQWKACLDVVIEDGVVPGVHVVAPLAGCGQVCRRMIQSFGRLVVLVMAGCAFSAQTRKLSDGSSAVA